MRFRDLLRILILNSIFTNVVNLASVYIWDYGKSQNRQSIILYGILIFSVQFLLISRLTKPFRSQIDYKKLFDKKLFLQGLFMAAAVWFLTQWTSYTTESFISLPPEKFVWIYLFTFLLNTIPAALVEEFLFRHLPLNYSDKKDFSTQQTVMLAVAITLLFSIAHVSAYLVRDRVEFVDLASPLFGAFFYGLAYFLIYAVTRNIYFVTLIHAFSNNPLYLVDSPFRETFYFYTYIFVTILWLFFREIKKRVTWENLKKIRKS